jgi:predicted extracellular nuclease
MKKYYLIFLFLLMTGLLCNNNLAQSKSIVMNEVYSRGTTTDPDWIELYNPTSADIDISNYKIYDSGAKGGTKDKKGFPSGTVIPAKGYYVVTTDGSEATDFGLSSSGEEVWLEDETGTVIDTVIFPALSTDQSYARVPDGEAWQVSTTITKGTSNGGSTDVQNSKIVMNEVYSRGTSTDPDWIELYNPTSADVDISSYKIYDSGAKGGTKDKKGFPSSTVIPAKGYYVITTDGSEATDFGLSSSGEEVWLEDETGTVIDTVIFPALSTDQSYARIPDGETWQATTFITKGLSNGTGTYVEKSSELASDYRLQQNYPNPFNPSTTITFSIPKTSQVNIEIFNVLGERIGKIVNARLSVGSYSVVWNAVMQNSGVYFYSIVAQSDNGEKFTQVKKMLFLK